MGMWHGSVAYVDDNGRCRSFADGMEMRSAGDAARTSEGPPRHLFFPFCSLRRETAVMSSRMGHRPTVKRRCCALQWSLAGQSAHHFFLHTTYTAFTSRFHLLLCFTSFCSRTTSAACMFKGLSFHTGVEGRAARRLATVAESARRSKQRHLRETARESTLRLNRLRAGQQSLHRPSPRRSRAGVASAAMQASWTATQAEALAEEDAAWSARDPMQPFQPDGTRTDAFSRPFSSASLLHYGAVDAETGNSIVQQSFDALVYRAVLHYGPPLPVEVVLQNNVVSAASMSPAQQRAQFRETQDGGGAGGADDPNAVYMDEVGLRMHEFMTILRKEQPHFSVRDDCDGVPLSLMVRNCSYLRAYGGKVNYMRFVRRLPRGQGGDMGRETTEDTGEEDAASGTMVVSLGRYKMREMPSQDGIRQGPQPWRYSYRTL